MARTHQYPAVSMIRWGAVVAGAAVGVALMALLTSFFVALGSEASTVANNLHWYGFISAIVALFVAGLLAGALSRERGIGTGILHGVTAWGVTLAVALAFPFPQVFGLPELFTTPVGGNSTLWAGFLSLGIGLIAAAIGGLLGGMITPRPAIGPDDEEREVRREPAAGRGYEPERGFDGGRGNGGRGNGGRAYEPERGYGAERPSRTEPITEERTPQSTPGRRRR